MDTSKKKKSIKQRAKKAIVTQDNRFIYAKYDMNANELKFFMWIVAQLNSQKDSLFQVCEIPVSEIFQVFDNKSNENFTYVKNIIDNMAKKVYIEDFKLLDEKTMKEVEVHRAMPLFQFLEYKKGEANVSYRLNDSLMQYLLDLKRDFTQIKFDDIQQMKSAYSIRIYNMLVCELKQNKQSLKINLSALQNILEVPKSFYVWEDFKKNVLAQAKKDINTKSNLVLLDIKTFKTGRKITDLEFIFDYKNNDKRIKREQEKEQSFYNELIKIIQEYIGKSIYQKRFGEMIIISYQFDEEKKDLKLIAKRKADDKFVHFGVKSFKDINALKKAKDKAEELFYLDEVKVLKSKEAQNKYRSLFD
ncbi:replication initiation protein [Campylobacter sp. MIT 12-5580]|uniref:replication initiation protein n=1 Tax=Campylobacter sp. MIT 12-5580 TaxID=2040651 RepID=UPI0010F9B1A8|nr:replication initiation protein [Campylobacter sp. MIT 12-5580]TKX28072.1 replication initiation protein [Campylobacter sp. MIT 12-5580]